MARLCYINGEIMPASEGSIGIADIGFQRGYGVFDYGRTYNGKLFHFDENIERLSHSASELHLKLPVSDGKIFEIVGQLIAGSDLKMPAVRMMLTGGYNESLENPNFIIIAEELLTYPDEIYEKGIRMITYEFQRELPHIKSLNYLNAIRLQPLISGRNATDVLYYSKERGVTEGPRNNFFVFSDDKLVTPGEDVLHGLTRKIVLNLAAEHFRVEERRMFVEELEKVEEAFVTSTTKGILPVTVIDDKPVGNGEVGERTKILMRSFRDYVEGY